MVQSLCGQLLLASPALMDPNFRRAVILIGVHSEEGAMGVVLNRPSEVTVSEAVPQLEQTVAEQEPVYVGGPVQPSSTRAIGSRTAPCRTTSSARSPRISGAAS